MAFVKIPHRTSLNLNPRSGAGHYDVFRWTSKYVIKNYVKHEYFLGYSMGQNPWERSYSSSKYGQCIFHCVITFIYILILFLLFSIWCFIVLHDWTWRHINWMTNCNCGTQDLVEHYFSCHCSWQVVLYVWGLGQ